MSARIVAIAVLLAVLPISSVPAAERSHDPAWGDFSLNLSESVAPEHHVAVTSGWTVATPLPWTVLGAGRFFAPPITCHDFRMNVRLTANGHAVSDPTLGKSTGLLYAGATWRPERITCHGTYHDIVDGRPVSFAVESDLTPLFGQAGFLLKATFRNRGDAPLTLRLEPQVQPGTPAVVSLTRWDFGIPTGKQPAKRLSDGVWANDQVRLARWSDSLDLNVAPGAAAVARIAIVASAVGQPPPQPPTRLADLEARTAKAWGDRLAWALQNIPTLETDIPGLAEYYRRSVLSGLVCLWENPAFALNPHVATCGLDGGGLCSYVWDLGGYAPAMLALELGDKCDPLVRRMASLDLAKHYAYTPDGSGVGVGYSYSPFALTNFVWTMACHDRPKRPLFEAARDAVLAAERRYPSRNGLLDYGSQHNLLEMRSAGYEHFVPSPNAERAWCFDRLADLGDALGQDAAPSRAWRDKASQIRAAVKRELWDPRRQWFKCLYPDGHAEYVYSIQMFDVLRAIGDAEIREGLLAHLRPGAFLANYGVQSVSREDRVHFEVFDTDWSGGGAYVGDGAELAKILYQIGEPDRAWDVLRRYFWMGTMLPYYPQEVLADRPAVPGHKRANCNSGLAHAEAILYGLAGFEPRLDGSLWIAPHPPKTGRIDLKGYRLHGHHVDVFLEPDAVRVVCDGRRVYAGPPKRVRIF